MHAVHAPPPLPPPQPLQAIPCCILEWFGATSVIGLSDACFGSVRKFINNNPIIIE